MIVYHLALWLMFYPDIERLGANEFLVREQAEARLVRHADLCFPFLPVDHRCPEIRRRARRIKNHAVFQSYPPIALLCDKPLPEWWPTNCDASFQITFHRPGPDWVLMYLKPTRNPPWSCLVFWYGERARTQRQWMEWHLDADGREATRLFCQDLLGLGVPPAAVRWLVHELRHRELALNLPPEK